MEHDGSARLKPPRGVAKASAEEHSVAVQGDSYTRSGDFSCSQAAGARSFGRGCEKQTRCAMARLTLWFIGGQVALSVLVLGEFQVTSTGSLQLLRGQLRETGGTQRCRSYRSLQQGSFCTSVAGLMADCSVLTAH